MDIDLVVKVFALILVANGTPIIASRLIGSLLSQPLDGGMNFVDGRALLGRSKTIRGVISSFVTTTLLAPVINIPWTSCLTVAAAAMAGDLVSSFIKRRLGFVPGSRATGLDQIPEALFPALVSMHLFGLTIYGAAAAVALFVAGEIVLSRLLFRLGVRRRPH